MLPVFIWALEVRRRRLQAVGGPELLLIWLYVMANVIVFGAEVNWWRRATPASALLSASPPAPGASAPRFQSSPSSAMVRSSPSGTKTGS